MSSQENTITFENQASAGTAVSLLRSIAVDISPRLPAHELARLNRTIENALPNRIGRVVQFTSAYHGEGTEIIAFEVASIAATLIGRRVLFIDTAPEQQQGAARELSRALMVPLNALFKSQRSLHEVMIGAAGTNLFYASLRPHGEESTPSVTLTEVEEMLKGLRPYYDLIVIHSPAILKDGFGSSLAQLADGTVLIVEAERTRAPVASEIKRLIQTNGGHLIGTVLNKRRFYIPRWLYRRMY